MNQGVFLLANGKLLSSSNPFRITLGMTLEHDTVVSAKIPKKLKQELERSGINMSEAIRNGLESALKESKIDHLERLLREVDLSGLSDQQIVRDIRTGRERKSRR